MRPSGVTATWRTSLPRSIVAVTVFVAVSMTDTVLEPEFVTYTILPLGGTATPTGWLNPGMVVVTLFFSVLITETVLEPKFVM